MSIIAKGIAPYIIDSKSRTTNNMTHYLQSLIKAFQRLPMTVAMTTPVRTTFKAAMLLVVALLLLHGSTAASIETDMDRSFFLVRIPCHPDFVEDTFVPNEILQPAGLSVKLNANQKAVFEFIRNNAPTDILDAENDILETNSDILETNRPPFNGEYIATQLGMPYVTV